jgi:aminopeptidase N/ABC-type transport system involved in multi-copper enzyme maturation permease subunit
MFGAITRFEIRYQLRSPVFWVGCALFFLLAFGATTMQEIQIGARGNVNVNSPAAIIETLGVMGVFGIFVATAFVAGAVIRDDETGFAPILRATRVGKPAYVFGRFVGATLVAWLVMAAVALGIQVGSFMPWVDAAKVGPQVPWHYLWALVVYVLPTLLVISAGFFALAIATRSLMWTYIGAVAALVLFVVSRVLLRDPSYDTFSALSDPFGLSPLRLATKYWTASERNTQLPGLEGVLLANRALWLTVAALLLALGYRLFRMDGRALWPRGVPASADAAAAPVDVPPAASSLRATAAQPARGDGAGWAQFMAIARLDARLVFRSPAFFVLLALAVVNSFAGLWFSSQLYGTEIFPVTRVMVQALEGSFTLFTIIIAVFYAGELVWRDRQMRMHEIVDATAAPDWVHLLPKIAAIAGVLALTNLAGVVTAVFVQLLRGYTTFEFSHYLAWFVLPQTVGALLLAVLAVFVQTLVPHKMIGWAAMLVYVVATIALNAAGLEHNLNHYAGTPPVPLSDMNGVGHFWVGRAWFLAYWSAFALMLAVLAYLLRRRGAQASLKPRLRALPARLRGPAGAMLGAAALAWLGLGGWIFYNTNVLNDFVPRTEAETALADYERELLPYETLPQPTITDVTLDAALYPRERRAVISGSYRIENRTGGPLDHVHLRWVRPLRMVELQVPGAILEREYKKHDYRIYRFAPALAPGQSRTIIFKTELVHRGFGNDAGPTHLVDNGSFLNNFEVAPLIGMDRSQLLKDRSKRRKHGLPPELRMAKLEDEGAREHHYLRSDSDWVNASITLSTDADQVPVAPGAVVSDSTTGGRRTLVTRTEAPIQHFFSLQSGRYAIREKVHQGITLRVYHLPGHAYNVQRMLDAMAASIDLYSASFSPYQFKHARVLEFPAYADFAQAFAGTIPYSEGIGFIINHKDEEKIDMVTYVTAHEIAHQWWAHQVIGANQQGSTLLSESFAQYSALMVMEKLYGRDQIRRFLKYELDQYLRSRGGELIEELPLARVENQGYIHYQKGALTMYWLKEVVGQAVVDRALKRLLEQYAFKAAPYPTSRDFLRLLRHEAGPAHDALITDLFERITLMDAKVSAAQASRLPDGRWEVVLAVQARKLVADGKGVETEAPLDEPFDIGVFTAEPGKKGFSDAAVLLMERRPVRSGAQQIRVVVAREPAWAGIDPYNKRIDRNSDDNLKAITK